MGESVVKIGGLFSLLTVLVAYFFKQHSDLLLQEHLKKVLLGLIRAERKVSVNNEPKIAVGFGSCLDVVTDAVTVLNLINASAYSHNEHFSKVTSKEELEKLFGYFFEHGAAAERFVENTTLFDSLVAAALSLPISVSKIGGNAAVMASRFQTEGAQVLLGAKISDKLRQQIHSDIRVVGGQLQKDDIHLLLEYPKGEVWHHMTTPRANRLILHSDVNNPYLTFLEEFFIKVNEFDPKVLVVSGLQMMDSYPFQSGERKVALTRLGKYLEDIPALVHFEMASFAEDECLREIIEDVVMYSDSLGMNEQELPNLYSVLTNGSVVLISDAYPRVASTLDHMRSVYRALRAAGGKVTRLHIHTLAYQAILTAKNSPWKNIMSATAKASLVANRHTCGSDYIELYKAKIILDEGFASSTKEHHQRIEFEPQRPVACWTEDDIMLCVAPNLVCTKVVQTGGGGDNISAAGLILQI